MFSSWKVARHRIFGVGLGKSWGCIYVVYMSTWLLRSTLEGNPHDYSFISRLCFKTKNQKKNSGVKRLSCLDLSSLNVGY